MVNCNFVNCHLCPRSGGTKLWYPSATDTPAPATISTRLYLPSFYDAAIFSNVFHSISVDEDELSLDCSDLSVYAFPKKRR